jgi:hypothetical protein
MHRCAERNRKNIVKALWKLRTGFLRKLQNLEFLTDKFFLVGKADLVFTYDNEKQIRRKFMLKKSFFGWCLILTFASAFFAQESVATTPAVDSTERMAIMNTLRLPIEKELKQKIQFTIKHFKATDTWAFIHGEPLTLKLVKPDYTGTRYQKAVDDGAFENNYQALLRKTAGKWRLIAYQIGCKDVCWLDWEKKHKAPKVIFPKSE